MKISLNNSVATIAAGFGVFAIAGSANAATPSPTKANGTFINGNGIFGDKFTVANGGGVQVALKARSFATGQPAGWDGGSVYDALPGYAPGRDPLSTPGNTRASWTFDYQFTPAAGQTPADYVLRLEQDMNPAWGTATYFTTQGSPAGVAGGGPLNQFDSDGFKVNPGGGAWSDNVTPFVHSQSWNYEFNFYPATYNPNDLGEYQINLTAYLATDVTFSSPLASSSIMVQVPEPTTVGVLGLAGVGLLARRRRR